MNRQPSAVSSVLPPLHDHLPTVGAIGVLAFILSNLLHEALGHAAVALLTVSPFGMLTSAGWASAYDNTLAEIAGSLINLAAAALLCLLLRNRTAASAHIRLFLLLACAFTLLSGTGCLGIFGLTDYGDWYSVFTHSIHWTVPCILLSVFGVAGWCGAVVLLGRRALAPWGRPRALRLLFCAWLFAVAVASVAASANRLGPKFVLLADFPITMLALLGLLLVPFFVPRRASSAARPPAVTRSWPWIGISAFFAAAFVLTLGRGLTLSR